MDGLCNEVHRVTGSRPSGDATLYDSLASMAYEGLIEILPEDQLLRGLPSLAASVIQTECGGEIKNVDWLIYSHDLLGRGVSQEDIEAGVYLSDISLGDDFGWYDYYFDAVDTIIGLIRKKSVLM